MGVLAEPVGEIGLVFVRLVVEDWSSVGIPLDALELCKARMSFSCQYDRLSYFRVAIGV